MTSSLGLRTHRRYYSKERHAMATVKLNTLNTQPVVFISYSWVDKFDKTRNRWGRAADPRARELADRLRDNGMDVRLDVYFLEGLHGFSQPEPVPGDPQD